MPMIKSNHGSMGSSGFVLRRTWNPHEASPGPCDGCGAVVVVVVGSESNRAMKRFRAPNMISKTNGTTLAIGVKVKRY